MGLSVADLPAIRLPVLFSAVLAISTPSIAQENYPNRTVKLVVPSPPGSELDALPRVIADKLSSYWGQPVIIENKAGAAQNLGAEVVARAEPDGYMLLATPPGPLVISQYFYPKLGFDPTAFVPVTIFASQPLVLVANPKLQAQTFQHLIALARLSDRQISFGSPGTGSVPHLTGELLKGTAGIDLVHVPYKGMVPALTDLLAGHVDVMVANLGIALPHINDGKLKLLAIADRARVPEFPDVPTIEETFPGVYSASWYAIVAPPKTPLEIATKLSRAISDVLVLPEVVQRYRASMVSPVGTSPEETATFLQHETDRWRKLINARGLKLE